MSDIKPIVEQYKEIYNQLKKKFRWKMVDNRIWMMIAANYVVNKQSFDVDRFDVLSEFIKTEVGTLSTLKNYQRYTTAAMLDVRFEDPKDKFIEMMDLYNVLVSTGFTRGAFTYITSLILLNNTKNSDKLINKTYNIYKAMKKEHPLLTTSSDYPLAALLAMNERSVESTIKDIDTYYSQLTERGFKKGNDLQFLSHILSIDTKNRPTTLIERCMNVTDVFRQVGIKQKPKHYPIIGLLTMVKDVARELVHVQEGFRLLNSSKEFKRQKDINLMMAVNFLISSKSEDANLLETEIYTTMEIILQAQQAALIAAIAGTTAATSSNSGGA